MDVVDSCVDCVNAYVRQYTDRNKVLHQCMYVVMVMVYIWSICMFKRKVGGSRVRRWRHLKARGHQGL